MAFGQSEVKFYNWQKKIGSDVAIIPYKTYGFW